MAIRGSRTCHHLPCERLLVIMATQSATIVEFILLSISAIWRDPVEISGNTGRQCFCATQAACLSKTC